MQKQADSLSLAIQNGNLDLLEQLVQSGHTLSRECVHVAVTHTQLPCLRYLVDHGCFCDLITLEAAYDTGDLGCFKYVYHKAYAGYPIRPVNMSTNVTDSNVDCYIYGYHHATEAEKTDSVLHNVMLYKGVESIKYGIEQGLPLHRMLYNYAMMKNDFAAVQYLHELGCPWDASFIDWASSEGKVEFVKFATENGCPH